MCLSWVILYFLLQLGGALVYEVMKLISKRYGVGEDLEGHGIT
jgi:hypothetical protein